MNNGKNTNAARALAMGVAAALVIVSLAGTGAAVSGLVAEWHFDGNAQDSSGNGNHGTINGATFTTGISGQALSFDGLDDYVTATDNGFSSSTSPKTVSAWIKTGGRFDSYGNVYGVIFNYGTASNANMFWVGIHNDGNIVVTQYGESYISSGVLVTDNKWHNIVVTYDGSTYRTYIDGVQSGSKGMSTNTKLTGNSFIGDSGVESNRKFNGLIDEVRLYNLALTASEIQAEYNAVISPPPTTAPPTTAPPTTVPPTTVPPTTVPPTTVPPTTVPPTTAPPTTVPPTTVSPTITTPAPPKFRVGPSVTLRPVNDVIEENQDGIVELFMNNPSLNDVTLNVDAQVSVPAGLHVSGENFGESAGAGVVAGTFSVPPGKARTISITIKADKSARKGSHTLQFTGLYYPDGNKDAFQPISLTYAVTVERPSKETPTAIPTATPKEEPGFEVILAGIGMILALAHRRR